MVIEALVEDTAKWWVLVPVLLIFSKTIGFLVVFVVPAISTSSALPCNLSAIKLPGDVTVKSPVTVAPDVVAWTLVAPLESINFVWSIPVNCEPSP